MALLQIAEPGDSTAPHQHRLAVGIDLGTTNSLVASVRSGVATCLADELGRTLMPSVVRYDTQGVADIGFTALAAAPKHPADTIISVKRMMGRSFTELPDAVRTTYRLKEEPGMVKIVTSAGTKSPVEVSADILRALRVRAEGALGGELVGAVVTVPAYFDDAQRQATKDAARLAGLNVLRLLNEPTAAAVAYGLDNASEGIYAVYDLGGGTFDISILKLTKGVFEVLATNGDSALGGDDFDRVIAAWAANEAKARSLNAEQQAFLLQNARVAKEALSSKDVATVTVPTSLATHKIELTRAVFQQLTQALVEKTLGPTRRAIRDAKLSVDEVKGVVLVGGATRMPHIRKAVAELFKQEPLTNLNPDEVVALGAAIQANALAGNKTGDDWLLLDVIPLSLGIETMGGLVEKIIPRNSTIPTAKAQDFTTFKDGQTAMSFHVVQGERELVSDCRSLARFELRGIPPMVAGAARIRVTFQVDADGLLSVSARELSTGVESSVAVKPSYGLADDEIATMLKAAYDHAQDDKTNRVLAEERLEAARLLEALESALKTDRGLLSHEEADAIDTARAALEKIAQTDNSDAIRAQIKSLAALTEPFAARRMDANIKKALTGRTVDELAIR